MDQLIAACLRDAVYTRGGRTWPTVDCYGMVLHVRRRMGLPEWPEWDGVTRDGEQMDAVGRHWFARLTACSPVAGAIACAYTGGVLRHVGVVVEYNNGLGVLDVNPLPRGAAVTQIRRFERHFSAVEYYW